MPECPECRTEVDEPVKKFSMKGRPDRKGDYLELVVGAFECPSCQKSFRKTIRKLKVKKNGSVLEDRPVKEDTIVRREGDNLRIAFPKNIAKHLGIKENDVIELWIDNHRVIIEMKEEQDRF